jgi:hypothetical protein
LDTTPFAIALGILAILGLGTLLLWSIQIVRYYQNATEGRYQQSMRNAHFKQVTAIACMFCLAMSASYGVIHSAWALIYLLLACKVGTWWFRFAIMQRA